MALVGSNLYWIYTIFDQGVTQMYTEMSLDSTIKQLEQTTVLANLNLKGLTKDQALEKIGKDVYGFDPFVKEGCIWAGQICVALNNNHVIGIGNDTL